MKIPEGWKLVPIEPTDEMRQAGMGYLRSLTEYSIDVYHKMLDAAPTPPVQFTYEAACSGLRYTIPEACGNVAAIHLGGKRWPVAMDGWRDALSEALDVVAQYAPGFSLLIERMEKILDATTPTPPAQGQVSLPKVTPYKSTSIPESEWRNEPIDYWLRKMLENCDYHDGLVIEATLNFLGGLKAPAPEAEPVAWVEVKDSHEGPYEFHGIQLMDAGKHNLYTHPTNDELRKAAREVIASFDEHIAALLPLPYWAVRDLQNLRAELDKDK